MKFYDDRWDAWDCWDNCGLKCDNCPIPKMAHSDKDWRAACKRMHVFHNTHEVKTIEMIDPFTGDTVLHTYVAEKK